MCMSRSDAGKHDMAVEQKDLRSMLETAVVAARLAGQRAMEAIDYVKVSVKNSTELVTEADRQCQEIILDRVKENYPDHGFIAEEGEEGRIFKQNPRGKDAFWWIVDPIDGTNNFAHRMLFFTVSIAVMHEGEPIVGVIFEPATDSMYTARSAPDWVAPRCRWLRPGIQSLSSSISRIFWARTVSSRSGPLHQDGRLLWMALQVRYRGPPRATTCSR